MTDNDLIKLFMPLLSTAMTAYGYPVTVRQSYQPITRGADTGATLYFFKVGPDKRIGQPNRKSIWSADISKFVDTDVQRMEATFQISSLVRQVPSTTTTQPTAADYLAIASMIMQGSEFVEAIQDADVGILKIGEIRNPYFKNDRDQFEASPSFDFTLIYNRSMIRDGKAIEVIDFNTQRI